MPRLVLEMTLLGRNRLMEAVEAVEAAEAAEADGRVAFQLYYRKLAGPGTCLD